MLKCSKSKDWLYSRSWSYITKQRSNLKPVFGLLNTTVQCYKHWRVKIINLAINTEILAWNGKKPCSSSKHLLDSVLHFVFQGNYLGCSGSPGACSPCSPLFWTLTFYHITAPPNKTIVLQKLTKVSKNLEWGHFSDPVSYFVAPWRPFWILQTLLQVFWGIRRWASAPFATRLVFLYFLS